VWVRLEVGVVQRFADVLSARFEKMVDGVYRVHVTGELGFTDQTRFGGCPPRGG